MKEGEGGSRCMLAGVFCLKTACKVTAAVVFFFSCKVLLSSADSLTQNTVRIKGRNREKSVRRRESCNMVG